MSRCVWEHYHRGDIDYDTYDCTTPECPSVWGECHYSHYKNQEDAPCYKDADEHVLLPIAKSALVTYRQGERA